MNKNYTVGIAIFLFFLLFIVFSNRGNQRFQQVIDASENNSIKKKLKAFQKDGIERPVSMKEYNAKEIIAYSKTFLDTPHKMGGTTKRGIDCSGLILASHQKFNIKLPHIAHEQARYGTIIPKKEKLEKGDLVFFYDSYTSNNFITHSGIYLGDGSFIHVSTLKGVIISELDNVYWKEHYLFGTRLID